MNTVFASLVCALALTPPPTGAGPVVSQPHVKAQLLAERAGVRPGGTVTLGVSFVVDSDWHIYWRDYGSGAGFPTTAEFALPTGWRVGPLRFPTPTSHRDELGDTSFIHEGTVVLLADLTAPADAKPGTTVDLAANAAWLVCKSECVKGEAKLTLSVPVLGTEPAPVEANERLFKKARRALPFPSADAKYLRLTVEPGEATIAPSDKLAAKLVLAVEKGYHIQSDKPTAEGLIATEVFLDPPSGFLLSAPEYPPAKTRQVAGLGKLSEFAGTVEIKLPFEVDAEMPKGPISVYGVLRYQACNDAGTCFPPISVEFEIPYNGATAGGTSSAAGAAAKSSDSTSGSSKSATGVTSSNQGGTTPSAPTPTARTWLDSVTKRLTDLGVVGYLLLAFIGGFILNFMPCVLPVISIKILSFVRQAQEDRLKILTLGSAFSAGIVVSFVALGGLILGLESQWGGLFQKPQVVIGLSAIVTAFALSLFGVFSLNPPQVVNALGEKVQGEGVGNAFGTGLLATALGTACTAPFLSAVVAIAVKQPTMIGFLIFFMAGVGMAIPYVLLAANPAWVQVVPRPGPWMGTFEHIVGFLLLGTVVWLMNPLGTQLGSHGLLLTLLFLLFVAAAAWVYGRLEYGAPTIRRMRAYVTIAIVLLGGWLFVFRYLSTIDGLMAEERMHRMGVTADLNVVWTDKPEIPWLPYSQQRAATAVSAGRTIFVDYTAEWCVNCKANEKLVLNTDAVRKVMRDLGVVPLKADYTSEDPEIKADLAKYGRSGVPMYLVVPAHRPDGAVVLPEILTPGIVVDALRAAGPSKAGG